MTGSYRECRKCATRPQVIRQDDFGQERESGGIGDGVGRIVGDLEPNLEFGVAIDVVMFQILTVLLIRDGLDRTVLKYPGLGDLQIPKVIRTRFCRTCPTTNEYWKERHVMSLIT